MKSLLHRDGAAPRSRGSVLVSLAVHGVAAVALGTMTFYAPILVGSTRQRDMVVEQIQFVRVQEPSGGGGGGAARDASPPRAERPAPVRPPSVVPSTMPPIQPAEPPAGGTPEGRGTGDGLGAARGVMPTRADPRLAREPVHVGSLPLTRAQLADSAVKAIWEFYRDSVVAAAPGRHPQDWTWERNGQKWGIDPQFIHLGKFRVPTALLALLPMPGGGVDGQRLLDQRSANWIRNDIWEHAQTISEDEFRAAVSRIRDRVDRERDERRRVQP